MPRSQHPVSVARDEWERLTENEVLAITFQVLRGEVFIARAGAEAPTGDTGWRYTIGEGERNIAIDEISSAVGGHVWAYGIRHDGSTVLVDHA